MELQVPIKKKIRGDIKIWESMKRGFYECMKGPLCCYRGNDQKILLLATGLHFKLGPRILTLIINVKTCHKLPIDLALVAANWLLTMTKNNMFADVQ